MSCKKRRTPAAGDLNRFLKVLQDDEDFNETRLTPLRVFILSGANVKTVRKVYETDSYGLDSDIIVEACKHGATKDVILFLVENFEERLLCWDFLEACQYVEDPEVLVALRAITYADEFCIGNYRSRFRGGPGPFVDLDYILRVGTMLPAVKKLEISYMDISWTQEAIYELARLVLCSKTLQSFNFTFPKDIIKSENRYDWFDMLVKSFISDQASPRSCGVQEVCITLPSSEKAHVNRALLVGLFHIPQLQKLAIVYNETIRHILPTLGKMVAQSKLQSLSIEAKDRMDGNYGKDISMLSSVQECLPIWDALKQNKHLESLKILAFSNSFASQIRRAMAEKLESLLQHDNTNLSSVTIGFINYMGISFFEEELGDNLMMRRVKYNTYESCLHKNINSNLEYLLALNKAGISLVRNSDSTGLTIERFVDLLAGLSDKVRSYNGRQKLGKRRKAIALKNSTIIQYGLLRENPGFWSNIVLKKGASRRRMAARGRKRKR